MALALAAVIGNLSDYEKQGVLLCTDEGTVLEVEQQSEFIMVIFSDRAPIFFRKSEISETLLAKLNQMQSGQKYKISCVHPAFRDDWQNVYDKFGQVTPKLVDIEKTAH